jgi:hypothetical protein
MGLFGVKSCKEGLRILTEGGGRGINNSLRKHFTEKAMPAKIRKRPDRHETSISFLPRSNRRARCAYICAIFGLVPILGLLFGPFAVILGLVGYRVAKNEPASDGLGHAFVSMLLGGLEFLTNTAGLLLLAIHYRWL